MQFEDSEAFCHNDDIWYPEVISPCLDTHWTEKICPYEYAEDKYVGNREQQKWFKSHALTNNWVNDQLTATGDAEQVNECTRDKANAKRGSIVASVTHQLTSLRWVILVLSTNCGIPATVQQQTLCYGRRMSLPWGQWVGEWKVRPRKASQNPVMTPNLSSFINNNRTMTEFRSVKVKNP